MFDQALDHVSITVADFEAARPFYEEVLGLKQDPSRPNFGIPGAWYQLGNSQIHLIQEPEGADLGTKAPKLVPMAPHLALRVADYDAAVDHFKARDIEVFETNAENGQLWVRDPSGNIIELTAR
jgi:glyoxylase I family protein